MPHLRMDEDVFTDGIEMLIGYEVVRLILGQLFDRYAWVADPPQTIQEYNRDRTRRIGGFYSHPIIMLLSQTGRTFLKDKREKILLISGYIELVAQLSLMSSAPS
ncbi:hypothetical protein V8F06_007612 [Rhypophila decipiens]